MIRNILLALGSACLLGLFYFSGYQHGDSNGRRWQQRSALRLPGTVDVYGCGVDRFVRIESSRVVHMHEFLAGLQPLPASVNAAFIETGESNQYCTLSELLDTNGMGSLPLIGGERLILVHAFK